MGAGHAHQSRNPDRRAEKVLKVSDTLVEELVQANTIVIGAPMYNFAIPAPLKAWIDQVVRVGKTVSVRRRPDRKGS